jgi:hypothetical protein
MKITKRQLKQIINEELAEQYTRGYHDRDAWTSGLTEQGCADTDDGCVREDDDGTWYILNNKKGGVWRKGFESKKSAKDSLEAMHSQKESLIREAIAIPEAIKRKGAEAGLAIILSMIATTAGREKLASILVAIPDFIKQYLCNLPSDWMQTSDGEKRVMVGSAYGMICRFGVTVFPVFLPLYALAWLLRLLSDDDASVIITTIPKPNSEEEKKSPDAEVQAADPPSDDGFMTGIWSPQSEPAIAESFSSNRMLLLSGISPKEE